MHDSSLLAMGVFFRTYLDPTKPVRLADIGSLRYGKDNTYKDVLPPGAVWDYVGMDLETGGNVDAAAQTPYRWPFSDEESDVVVSGQCAEHVEDIYAWFGELARILRPGGMAYVIAPGNGPSTGAPRTTGESCPTACASSSPKKPGSRCTRSSSTSSRAASTALVIASESLRPPRTS